MLNPLKMVSITGSRLGLQVHVAKFKKQIASGVQVIVRCCISKATLAVKEHIFMT